MTKLKIKYIAKPSCHCPPKASAMSRATTCDSVQGLTPAVSKRCKKIKANVLWRIHCLSRMSLFFAAKSKSQFWNRNIR